MRDNANNKELGIVESQKKTLMSADDREKSVAKRSRKVRGGVGAGVAIGVALGAAMGNMGAGIAIGIAMGAGIGIALDRARK